MICPYQRQYEYQYITDKKGNVYISNELEHFPLCNGLICPYYTPTGRCKKLENELEEQEQKLRGWN